MNEYFLFVIFIASCENLEHRLSSPQNTLETQAVKKECKEPSEEEKELFLLERREAEGQQCCPSYSRTACLVDGQPFPVSCVAGLQIA